MNGPFFKKTLIWFYFLAVILILALSFHDRFCLIFLRLGHDEAEHLHVAWLMSQGDRPFVDFMENHPMLFNHFLKWLRAAFSLETTRQWAQAARITIFLHFLAVVSVTGIWLTQLIRNRPRGILWGAMLGTSLAVINFRDPVFAKAWFIRPDYICYAWTLAGCFLIWLAFRDAGVRIGRRQSLLLLLGGGSIGLGNAVLPKGWIIAGAILLAWLASDLLQRESPLKTWCSRKYLMGFALAGFSCVAIFTALMLWDCRMSGITLSQWFSGVFLINSVKHIYLTMSEDNPLFYLATLLALPLPLLVGFFLWCFVEVAQVKEKGAPGNYLWSVVFFLILLNLFLAPFSNGATWPHYFIPSFFALALIWLMLLLRVWETITFSRAGFQNHLRLIGISVLVFVVFLRLVSEAGAVVDTFRWREIARREVQVLCPKDFSADQHYPPEFSYLAFFPNEIPVRSRQWNFYYMLADNNSFWKDCHRLGIGPNPQEVWKRERFQRQPPDAIVFESKARANKFVLYLFECQGLDISWLNEEIERNYVPVRKKYLRILVRKDRIERVLKEGWRVLPEFPFSIM